jgi:hypothetical protein
MHPVLIAIGIATTALLTILSAGAPLIRQVLKAQLAKAELERLRCALKGAAVVVSAIVKSTPTPVDDALARVLDLAEQEVGRALIEKYGDQARAYVAALHADKEIPSVNLGKGQVTL